MTQRLDNALVERGLCESRERAKRAIMAGRVRVNQQPARKASETVKPADEIVLLEREKYVSRGGHKLEHALNHFALDVTGLTALDVGASTGGFTDCLLQRGADKVYAIDVGRGQLAWSLRHDRRVVVMENQNARYLKPSDFPGTFQPAALAVMDCSFISLRKILPPVIALLRPGAKVVALVKPQFEAGKGEVDKGAGVITDPGIHERVLNEMKEFIAGLVSVQWHGCVESPLVGPAGNKEFLVLLEKGG